MGVYRDPKKSHSNTLSRYYYSVFRRLGGAGRSANRPSVRGCRSQVSRLIRQIEARTGLISIVYGGPINTRAVRPAPREVHFVLIIRRCFVSQIIGSSVGDHSHRLHRYWRVYSERKLTRVTARQADWGA